MPDIRRCLIIDTETSDLPDKAGDRAAMIEVGAILYSITNQTSLTEFSTLVPYIGRNVAELTNRIKQGAIDEMHTLDDNDWPADRLMAWMLTNADCLVSYNVEFDAHFFDPSAFALAGTDWPWLCAMADFKWPQANRQQGSLIHLALDHGIGVASAHRALTDCRIIAELFNRAPDVMSMFDVAMRPIAMFQSLQSFDDNQKARDAGFKWQRPGAPAKSWTRMMAIEDAATLPFPTRKLYNVSHNASDWVTLARNPIDLFP